MPVEIERSLEIGFFNYLTKPMKLDELMAALDVAIQFAQTKSAPADAKTN
jgi:DNA-binding response OmpR family regulator